MARGEVLRCDICRKETPKVAFKLFLAPAGRTVKGRAPHSAYTHHLDVGECCAEKMKDAWLWHPRRTAEEYRARNK